MLLISWVLETKKLLSLFGRFNWLDVFHIHSSNFLDGPDSVLINWQSVEDNFLIGSRAVLLILNKQKLYVHNDETQRIYKVQEYQVKDLREARNSKMEEHCVKPQALDQSKRVIL